MQTFSSLVDVHALPGNRVVAMGTFDGVHIGHQRVIGRAVELARRVGGKSAVFTFSNHPLSIIAPEYCPPQIITQARKAQVIASLGVDLLFSIPFTRELLTMSPEAFASMVCERLAPRWIVVGPNFTYGHLGKGTPEALTREGIACGYGVEIQNEVQYQGQMVSSTFIRQLIAAGEVERAAAMLGRPVELNGSVIGGEQRGRELGFPTANLAIPDNLAAPADGVYAAWVDYAGEEYGAVVNVGANPTFGGVSRRVEAYILDFDQSIYGHDIIIRFIARLRGEQSFQGPAELAGQIAQDVTGARRILGLSAQM